MSTPQLAAEANPRGGPNTPEGKANSSRNATTHGLLAARDFIRPGEETHSTPNSPNRSQRELATPNGPLELNLVEEIRRAMWRLRRCRRSRIAPPSSVSTMAVRSYIFDPMETANAAAEKVQKSVDRSRAQAHRLLHKCTAELRKLQSGRKQGAA